MNGRTSCGGGCVLIIMHGRIRKTSHPYNAGTEYVGFSPTRQTLLARSAKHREVLGESHEGCCILLSTVFEAEFLAYG